MHIDLAMNKFHFSRCPLILFSGSLNICFYIDKCVQRSWKWKVRYLVKYYYRAVVQTFYAENTAELQPLNLSALWKDHFDGGDDDDGDDNDDDGVDDDYVDDVDADDNDDNYGGD